MEDTRNLSLAMIQLLLEGAPGSPSQIAVIGPHSAKPQKMTLNRVVVVEPAVKESLYEGTSILYLKPIIIDREHVQQIETWLKDMNKDGNKKILLDLRDVSAGDMNEAVRLTTISWNTGTIATLEGQKYPKQIFSADPFESDQYNRPAGGSRKPWNLRPGGVGCRCVAGRWPRSAGRRKDLRRGLDAEDLRPAGRWSDHPVDRQVRVALGQAV